MNESNVTDLSSKNAPELRAMLAAQMKSAEQVFEAFATLREFRPPEDHPAHERFLAAEQALLWVMDPAYTSPVTCLVGFGEDIKEARAAKAA